MLEKCQKHLEKVDEGYFEHMRFAFSFGFRMLGGGIAAILHGIFPAIFDSTGSRMLFRLHDEVTARQEKCRQTRGDSA